MGKNSSSTSKMKVVHMITKLELGGAQVNTVYTHDHLNESQFEVYLLSGPGGILNDRVERKKNFHIIADLIREIRPWRDFRAFLQILKLLKRISPDILHTHSTKAGIIGRIAAFLVRIPVRIHSVHGFSFSPLQPVMKRTIYYLAELVVSVITSHFVFVAKADMRVAKKLGLVRHNYTLIRSGFPLQRFQQKGSDADKTKETYGIGPGKVVCGVVAPFKPQKGLFHLIDVAARVIRQDERAVFFLAGDGELRPALERELHRRGIVENFRLPGFLFDLERIMDIFDIGVTTALWEGLPQSLVQMRLKKIPIVASDIPGNREVIKQKKNGFLADVRDHDSLAGHILLLMDQPQVRLEMGDYPDDFSSWEASYMVQRQEKLYRRLLNVW